MDIAKLKQQTFYRQPSFWVTLAIVCLIALLVHFCSFQHVKKTKPGQLVVTRSVLKTNVPILIPALGSVIPTYSVTVKTQVNGQLMQVVFKEGQLVKAGDVLAQIDTRPLEAQLTQYQGQLTRDQALLANARLDLQRYQKLWQQNSVAKQTLDTQVALVQQDEGNVKVDEGLIQSTQVNLTYARITSPIDGRVGLRLVDPGNIVQTSDTTGIAVINMLNPITVVFTIPEDYIPEVMRQINAGQMLTVRAYDRQQNQLLAVGTLLTIDNQVDPTTGTVKLKATFANADNKLFPNQFVNIKLLLKTLQNATVVPTTAIQHSAQGEFVYLVKPDSTVAVKPVALGVNDNEYTCINSGVTPGQSVVVEGADKLTDGAAVTFASAVRHKAYKRVG